MIHYIFLLGISSHIIARAKAVSLCIESNTPLGPTERWQSIPADDTTFTSNSLSQAERDALAMFFRVSEWERSSEEEVHEMRRVITQLG